MPYMPLSAKNETLELSAGTDIMDLCLRHRPMQHNVATHLIN